MKLPSPEPSTSRSTSPYPSISHSTFRSTSTSAFSLSLSFDLDLYLDSYFNLYLDLDLYLELNLFGTLDKILKLVVEKSDLQLYQAIKNLRDQLPYRENPTTHQKWWKENGKKWAAELRAIMVKYRNIGHNWQFSDEQQQLLRQYYQANKFLTQCLAQECYVSRSVRQYIEETLLLPVVEIEKYDLKE